MKNYLNRNNLFLFIGIFVLASIIGIVSVIKGSDFLGIFFSFFLFFCLFIFFAGYPDQVLSKIIIIAFVLRSGLAYIHRFVFLLPEGGADAIKFERRAWEAAESWLYGKEIINLGGSYYYAKVIAWFYYLFERVPFAAQFLNVLLGTLIVFVTYKIALNLFNKTKVAHIAAGIVAFFPILNLYSAILLRETFIVFFLSLSFYFFIKWIKKEKLIFWLLSLIFIFICGIIHAAMILIGLAYFFIFLFYRPQKKKWVFISKRLVIWGLLAIIIFSLFFENFNNKIPSPSNFNLKLLEGSPLGRAAYLRDLIPNNYFDIVWQTPIRIIYFYFAPFPWQLKELLDLVGFVDVLFYIFLFIFCFRSLTQIKKENKAFFIVLLLVFIIFSITFAWGTSNYGTSLRHRQKIVFLLIIIASYSLSAVNWKKFLPRIK